MASARGCTSGDEEASRPSFEKARTPVPATVTTRGPTVAGGDNQAYASASPPRTTAITPRLVATRRRRVSQGRVRPGAAGVGAGMLETAPPSAGKPAVTQVAICTRVWNPSLP